MDRIKRRKVNAMDGRLVHVSRLKHGGDGRCVDWLKRILASGLTFWFFWATQAVQCEMFKDRFENLLSNNFGKNEGSFDKYCSRLTSFDCFDLIHVQHRVKR